MPYSEQQREANLTFFLHDFLRPAAEAVKSIDLLGPSSQDYSSFAILEAFLWLHLGVRLEYFPKAQSRRTMYEYANRLLAAYQRININKQLEKFTPPLRRILEAEFNGRVEVFSLVNELPDPSDELASAYQTALVLVGGFTDDPDTQQLLRMLIFATSATWETAMGRSSPSAIQEREQQIEV